MSNRRSFLRMLGVAPVAAPVAAKEAAVAMGLSSSAGTAGMMLGGNVPMSAQVGFGITNEKENIAKRMAALLSSNARDEARREIGRGRLLDADIAALRSVSPAFANVVQIERDIDARIDNEKRWLNRRLSDLTGGIL